MKKSLALVSAASIAALLSFTTAMAGGPVSSHSHFNASAELMWVKAAEPNNTPQNISGTTYAANQLSRKWQLGWAASVGYTFDNQSDVTFDFRYIKTKASGNSTNLNTSDEWTNDSRWKHQHANLAWGHTFNPINGFYLQPFINLAWVDTKNDYITTHVAGNNVLVPFWHSKFSGWGPGFGFNSYYTFGKNFAVIGGLTAAFPYGNMQTNGRWQDSDTTNDSFTFATDDKMFQPEAQINLGVRFANDITHQDDVTYFGELGYRAIHVWNAAVEMEQGNVTGVVHGNAFFRYGDVTFYGPYLKGGVSFGT